MTDRSTAIRAESLGKLYRIGDLQKYKALRDSLTQMLYSPFRVVRNALVTERPRPSEAATSNYIWALRDATFEVAQGEVLGLVGPNGAGKSTLLKVLSRITEPTEGFAEVRGRVGSLLEVGTGFHWELTGRENTYLNGAILGMSKTEIDLKFDEIVEFADISGFIDTPVKLYSSGMYLRLAFAIAAHLEPEILLVDEVLAVGDAAFQRKCLGKMDDVAKRGRTVILVSHQLNQIRRLCDRCMWIEGGRIRENGPTAEVVSAYEAAATAGVISDSTENRGSQRKGRFVTWRVVEPASSRPNLVTTLGPVTVEFTVDIRRPILRGTNAISLFDAEGRLVWASPNREIVLPVGRHSLAHTLSFLPLRPGVYYWRAWLNDDTEVEEEWNPVLELVIATELHTHQSDEWTGILNIPAGFRVYPANLD